MSRNRPRRPSPRDRVTQQVPHWRWRTLPVWLALTGGIVIGWYIAAAGANFIYEAWSFYVLIVALAAFSFGLSRVVNRYTMVWVAKRRQRNQEKRILKDPASRR